MPSGRLAGPMEKPLRGFFAAEFGSLSLEGGRVGAIAGEGSGSVDIAQGSH